MYCLETRVARQQRYHCIKCIPLSLGPMVISPLCFLELFSLSDKPASFYICFGEEKHPISLTSAIKPPIDLIPMPLILRSSCQKSLAVRNSSKLKALYVYLSSAGSYIPAKAAVATFWRP